MLTIVNEKRSEVLCAALTARNERIAALRRELTTIATGRASFHNLTVEAA